MIKLKINRSQLQALCGFANPPMYEAMVKSAIKSKSFKDLDTLFTLIQVGELLSKKYLFDHKDKYSISLKYAEGAALFTCLSLASFDVEPASYEFNVATTIKNELHQQITNYKNKFYGAQQYQNALPAGADQSTGGALANAARYIGRGEN